MFHLPKIYPITDRRITNLSHLEQCKRLIKGGSDFIQFREKSALSNELYESAKETLEFTRQENAKLIINDRVDIALAIKADGVHLGQGDLPPDKARRILGDEAIIGLSTHSIVQASIAKDLSINYIAIGPVFATNTKENPDEIVGIEGVEKVRNEIGDFPLVAIGGIDFNSFQKVLDAGADSVAIISGLLSDMDNISENFRRFNSQR